MIFRELIVASLAMSLFYADAGHAGTIWYVDDDATGANNGVSGQDAFNDLQLALAHAAPAQLLGAWGPCP